MSLGWEEPPPIPTQSLVKDSTPRQYCSTLTQLSSNLNLFSLSLLLQNSTFTAGVLTVAACISSRCFIRLGPLHSAFSSHRLIEIMLQHPRELPHCQLRWKFFIYLTVPVADRIVSSSIHNKCICQSPTSQGDCVRKQGL